MNCNDLSYNETQQEIAIEEVIQDAVKAGLLVDTGMTKWSERTKTFQTVWRRTSVRATSMNRLH